MFNKKSLALCVLGVLLTGPLMAQEAAAPGGNPTNIPSAPVVKNDDKGMRGDGREDRNKIRELRENLAKENEELKALTTSINEEHTQIQQLRADKKFGEAKELHEKIVDQSKHRKELVERIKQQRAELKELVADRKRDTK